MLHCQYLRYLPYSLTSHPFSPLTPTPHPSPLSPHLSPITSHLSPLTPTLTPHLLPLTSHPSPQVEATRLTSYCQRLPPHWCSDTVHYDSYPATWNFSKPLNKSEMVNDMSCKCNPIHMHTRTSMWRTYLPHWAAKPQQRSLHVCEFQSWGFFWGVDGTTPLPLAMCGWLSIFHYKLVKIKLTETFSFSLALVTFHMPNIYVWQVDTAWPWTHPSWQGSQEILV